MALNKVVICGVNTAKLPLLTNEEKNALFIQAEQGNKQARELLVEGNLRLVLSVIQRFSASSENADDLFQVGCIGLMKAIDNFDRSLNVKFSTYAVPMIIGECRRYLRDNNAIRVSRSLRDIAYKAIYAKERILREEDREPTIDEVAKAIEMDKELVVMALDAIATPVSLYDPVYQEGGDTLYIMDQVSDKKNKEENWVEDISMKEAMKHLSDLECNIITLRFFEGKTQTEVASEIAISQAQVSRLEKSALKSMKGYLDMD
ncbi:MAG: RNA polymerase sporulation sigma factor SigG [Lachnospiraceae bacterium]|nr:RNA polymerase sporulation sigma factor SigG [Lachnospiraceae bacterium]